ncbi:hypothetical protein [Streptomyces sp. KL116D]|uniref:hypothetical protein n=1 Tax=Streptomyces sp. KL116D TaxID=3045152 RepID=UPI0035565EB0
MCIRAQYAPLATLEPWDADRQLITIPSELRIPEFALRAVRAVLAELAIPQGELGARCWCGEPIRLRAQVPQQRRSGEVINSGA